MISKIMWWKLKSSCISFHKHYWTVDGIRRENISRKWLCFEIKFSGIPPSIIYFAVDSVQSHWARQRVEQFTFNSFKIGLLFIVCQDWHLFMLRIQFHDESLGSCVEISILKVIFSIFLTDKRRWKSIKMSSISTTRGEQSFDRKN